MKRCVAVIILLICAVFAGHVNAGLLSGITVRIMALSSSGYEGRFSGSAGGIKAGEYIAGEFKKLGLQSSIDGSYYQPFDIPVRSPGKNTIVSVAGRELKIFDDYAPLTVCPSGEVKGVSAEEGDFSGKIAVTRYEESTDEQWLVSKIKEAETNGAIALVILKKELYSDYTVWDGLIPPKLRLRWEKTLGEDMGHFLSMKVTQKRSLAPPVTSNIPCIMVKEDVYQNTHPHLNPLPEGEEITLPFKGRDMHVLSGVEGVGMGFSSEISIKVDIKEENIPARNVIGYLPGKGKNKDEVIIIGAHYDHMGLDSKGRHFPGADDNASGVAAMLEVAERLARKGTDRSIIFIAFDAEEWGLVGSLYYVNHPVIPLDKTVLMINMDTIGRNDPDSIHFLGSKRSPDVRELAGEIAGKNGLKLLDDIEFAFKYGSDHYPFYGKGVPAIDLTSGYHEDFHKITDTWEKVSTDKVTKVADFVYTLVERVADSDIHFQKPLQVEIPFPVREH